MKTTLSSKLVLFVKHLVAFVNTPRVDLNRKTQPAVVHVPQMRPTFMKKQNEGSVF